MAFQSTALIDSSIPGGEIKKIDRPSAFHCHSSQQLYVKLKTQLKFKLFQSDGAPQPMFHLIELWWKSDARVQSARQMGCLRADVLPVRRQKSCANTRHSEEVMGSDPLRGLLALLGEFIRTRRDSLRARTEPFWVQIAPWNIFSITYFCSLVHVHWTTFYGRFCFCCCCSLLGHFNSLKL